MRSLISSFIQVSDVLSVRFQSNQLTIQKKKLDRSVPSRRHSSWSRFFPFVVSCPVPFGIMLTELQNTISTPRVTLLQRPPESERNAGVVHLPQLPVAPGCAPGQPPGPGGQEESSPGGQELAGICSEALPSFERKPFHRMSTSHKPF